MIKILLYRSCQESLFGLQTLLVSTICLMVLISGCSSVAQNAHQGNGSKKSAAVSTALTSIGFPVYNVLEFGAVGDGKFLNTRAIQRAIDRAAEVGGGTVYFPPGTFLSGTIRLKSNTTIFLEQGCTLSGSKRLSDYDVNFTNLIYSRDAHNVSICGPGVINGNGPSFWDNGRLEKWLKHEIDLPRTKDMIRFDRCRNIRLENVLVTDGAFWNIGFGDCSEITICGIKIRTGVYEKDGPNTDGINLWNCQKVAISNCDIVTGDDCIVVLGESRDVTITNCQLQTSETALMISGVRNLAFSNSTIHDSGCGIGFRAWNGILVDGVVINNIVMDVSDRFKGGGTAIYIWSFPIYVETSVPPETKLPPPGVVKNINISNLVATANGLVCVNGCKDGFVNGLTLDNIRFTMFGGKVSQYNDNPPYPYPIYGFHHGSPYGMFFRYVNDLVLRDVQVRWNEPEQLDWGSALRCWDVKNLEVSGFSGRQSKGSKRPAISLDNVEGVFVHNCQAPAGTATFLELLGETQSVTVIGNDLHRANKSIENQSGSKLFLRNNHMPTKEPDDK